MKKNFIKNFITKRKKLSLFLTVIFVLVLLWLRSVFFWNINTSLYDRGGKTW